MARAAHWMIASFVSCALIVFGNVSRAAIIVDSVPPLVNAGVTGTAGQVFQITATGRIQMAVPPQEPYETDPDGTILVAPAEGSALHQYMLDEGGVPVVGGYVNISSRWTDEIGRIVGSPFGGLMAGFSTTATPTSLSDFVHGFTFIGSSGFITAPEGAPYLFLSINDTDRSDNSGSYSVTVSEAQLKGTFYLFT